MVICTSSAQPSADTVQSLAGPSRHILIDRAVEFVETTKEEVSEQSPLGRLHAGVLLADFVRELSEPVQRIERNYSLTVTPICTSNHGFWELRVSKHVPTEPVLVIPPEFPDDEDEDDVESSNESGDSVATY